MMGWKENSSRPVAWSGLAAALTLALSLTACESSSYSPKLHDVGVLVLAAGQTPVAGVGVKAWILDSDVPGDSRTPIELETRITNAQGRAEWTYEAFEAPYFIGYEVRASDGLLLAAAAPRISERLNVATGQLTVVLP